MTEELYQKTLRKRHRKCKVFRIFCFSAVIFSAAFLAFFFQDIIRRAIPAFSRTEIQQTISYKDALEQRDETDEGTKFGDSSYAFSQEIYDSDIISRQIYWDINRQLKDHCLNETPLPEEKSEWLIANTDVDQYVKNGLVGKLKPAQTKLIDDLKEQGNVRVVSSGIIFSNSDSRNPEIAGIKGAAVGTLWIILVTVCVSVPIGVMSALYLEEYAPKNKLSSIIEININNLAAVPSIIFGLLGLLVFLNFLGLPRSSPLVGGLTLGLMMLPIMIISTRAALRSVPNNIREAALAVGASKWQTIQHHVLPLAIPGILTGTILSMAQAMGETAPLLMVGLNSFVTDVPTSINDPSSSLPTLIFQWASSSERGFTERTAAAILIMLTILIIMNGLAVWMRNKFERRW